MEAYHYFPRNSSVDERVQSREFRGVFAVLTASFLTFSLSTGQVLEAPDRLISKHGIELINDGRVFLLFAGLNGLGYSKETLRQGPPLEAPVFHPLRIVARDALRKLANQGKLQELKKLFTDHAQPIDHYLALILSYDRSLSKENGKATPAEAIKLSDTVSSLRALSEHKEVVALLDAIALKQREHAKSLMAVLEEDFAAAEKYLGLESLTAPASISIIPNPLDAHNMVRRIQVQDRWVFVVGPGHGTVRTSVLNASLRPRVKKWVAEHWKVARKLQKQWRSLKVSKRINERFADGQAYLTETLTRTLIYRAGVTDADKKLEAEDFIDKEGNHGFRWTRACLKALDKFDSSSSIETQFSAILKSIAP